jgi:hypothetical protein
MKLQQLIDKWSPQWHPAIRQTIHENELYEGLIYSYSTDKTIASIHALLSRYGNVSVNTNFSRNIITFHLYKDNIASLSTYVDQLERIINTCGWFIAGSSVIVSTDPTSYWFKSLREVINSKTNILNRAEQLSITLEPKYGIEVSEIEKQHIQALYHATPSKNIKRILHHGLTPRSQSKLANHPERIYLAVNYGDAKDFSEMSNEIKSEGDFIILKIDRSILNKIRLFHDPAFRGAFYTLSNIPPQYISEAQQKQTMRDKVHIMFRSI